MKLADYVILEGWTSGSHFGIFWKAEDMGVNIFSGWFFKNLFSVVNILSDTYVIAETVRVLQSSQPLHKFHLEKLPLPQVIWICPLAEDSLFFW